MPTTKANGITLNYQIDGDRRHRRHHRADQRPCRRSEPPGGSRSRRSSMPATAFSASTTAASAASDQPAGAYTSRQMADDAKALVDQLEDHRFPPDGGVDGRHDRAGICAGLSGRSEIRHPRLHLWRGRSVLPDHVRHVGRHRAEDRRALRDARRGPLGLHRPVLRRSSRRGGRVRRGDGGSRR